MRDEVLAEIRWLRLQKGFSDAGIARHTRLPLDVVRAAIAQIERPSPKAKPAPAARVRS